MSYLRQVKNAEQAFEDYERHQDYLVSRAVEVILKVIDELASFYTSINIVVSGYNLVDANNNIPFRMRILSKLGSLGFRTEYIPSKLWSNKNAYNPPSVDIKTWSFVGKSTTTFLQPYFHISWEKDK